MVKCHVRTFRHSVGPVIDWSSLAITGQKLAMTLPHFDLTLTMATTYICTTSPVQETPNLECWSNKTRIYDSDCSQRFNTRSSTLSESCFNLSNRVNGLLAWRNSIYRKLIFSCNSVCMAPSTCYNKP